MGLRMRQVGMRQRPGGAQHLCQAVKGPGRCSSRAGRLRSSAGKMGSCGAFAGFRSAKACLSWLLLETCPAVQSQGRPVLGHSLVRLLLPVARPSFWLWPLSEACVPSVLDSGVGMVLWVWPLLAFPLLRWLLDCLLAAMDSSVYAVGSALAKTLKASRMGR